MTRKSKLLTKDQVFEWLNPVLSGETNAFSSLNGNCDNNFQSPSNPFSNNNCDDDFLENPPEWLNTYCDQPSSPSQVGVVGNGYGRDTLGAMFIDGVPVSDFGAQYGGTNAYFRKNVMNNFIEITNHITSYMADISVHGYKDDQEIEFNIKNIIIQRMIPTDSGIGINIYLSFDFNGINYFANFYKFGVTDTTGYNLICEPLKDTLSEENWIRLRGKLKNILEKWLQPASGIYKCEAKEVLVYNQFGQLNRIKQGDIVELLKSDKEKIMLMWNNVKWYVKTPTYWWFNYYFTLLKK